MANTLGLSLCLVCVLLLPLWLQQIFADDAGLLAIGGGRLTHEHVFGGRREPGYPPILFHCLAYSGVLGIHLMALSLYVAFRGSDTARVFVGLLTLSLLGSLLALQWSHPWHGEPPASWQEMPVPLLLTMIAAVTLGTILDTSP